MEESQLNPKKKKKLLETNRILSLTALFVSVCTLFILLYQTHLSNKMYYLEERAQKMSVFPYLELGPSISAQQHFKLLLLNSGIGPALIKNVNILYKDSTYQLDPSKFLDNVIQDIEYGRYASIYEGRLISANDVLEVLTLTAEGHPDIDRLTSLFNSTEFNIAIEYTSIYEDQTWTCYLKETPVFPGEPAP